MLAIEIRYPSASALEDGAWHIRRNMRHLKDMRAVGRATLVVYTARLPITRLDRLCELAAQHGGWARQVWCARR